MIDIQELTYTYPHAANPALQQISMKVEQGESIGIVGANCAGKSTLCYALMGLAPHFFHGTIGGDVWVDGVNAPDASMAEMAKHVGLVFQDPSNQFSGSKMTVEEEIAFGLENLGINRAEMIDRIQWVLDLLDIASLRYRDPYQLSGGQMQRVAIASILALKPKVLVLDEPTSQLDPVGTKDVFDAIDTLRAEDITTVIVEHKTELLVEHCSRIAVIHGGKLLAFDRPSTVFSHPDAESWGIEIPRYSQAYRRLDPQAETVPTRLSETVERLKCL
jgi:energy-coupling factor transport system ATP-binding protein